MHGLSTGLGLKEQKSTEFMQAMGSVLHDDQSLHASVNEFSIDDFCSGLKQQLV